MGRNRTPAHPETPLSHPAKPCASTAGGSRRSDAIGRSSRTRRPALRPPGRRAPAGWHRFSLTREGRRRGGSEAEATWWAYPTFARLIPSPHAYSGASRPPIPYSDVRRPAFRQLSTTPSLGEAEEPQAPPGGETKAASRAAQRPWLACAPPGSEVPRGAKKKVVGFRRNGWSDSSEYASTAVHGEFRGLPASRNQQESRQNQKKKSQMRSGGSP